MADYDRLPSYVHEARKMKSRVAELEKRQMGRAQAELDANRDAEWQAATLVNGFSNAGAGYAPAAFYKDTFGRVFVRGRVSQGGTFAPVTIFTLPAGFRPVYRHEFPTSAVYADSVTRSVVTVETSGAVMLTEGDAGFGFPVNLDIVQFRNL